MSLYKIRAVIRVNSDLTKNVNIHSESGRLHELSPQSLRIHPSTTPWTTLSVYFAWLSTTKFREIMSLGVVWQPRNGLASVLSPHPKLEHPTDVDKSREAKKSQREGVFHGVHPKVYTV